MDKEKLLYVLSPVRGVTPDQSEFIARHVQSRKDLGFRVFNPVEDAPQQDETGFNIVMAELNFLHQASRSEGGAVDILWNLGGKPSEGSRVDVGMAIGLDLDLNLIEVFNQDQPPSGPQIAYRIIEEIVNDLPSKPNLETAFNLLDQMKKDGQATIDWDVAMTGEEQEWQRIRLGLALSCQAWDPAFKIKMGNLVGLDPVGIKSYPKVISELERRSVL